VREYKRRMSPVIAGLPRWYVPHNDGGMDSRFRGNDRKRGGNDREGYGNDRRDTE